MKKGVYPAQRARLTECATPTLGFINVIVFPIHVYVLLYTDWHVGCIIIATTV